MRSKNLVLSLLFVALSILFCAGILAANLVKGNNAFNISESRYSPGQIINGILNVSFQNMSNNYIIADVDSKKFSMLLSDFLNTQPNITYTCNPTGCQPSYQGSNPLTSKSYAMNNDSKVLFGLRVVNGSCASPNEAEITTLTFDLTGSEIDESYPLPSIDIGDDGTIDWQYLEPSESTSAKIPSNYVITTPVTPNDLMKDVEYCEKISLLPASKFRLKTNVTTDDYETTLSIYDSLSIEGESTKVSCTATAPDFECELNKTITEVEDYYVCVAVVICDSPDACGNIDSYNGAGNPKDGILYDKNSGLTISLDGDLPIDVYFAGYKPLEKTITVSSDKLTTAANGYILNAQNCNNASSCIIPVSISTTSKGNLLLDNLNLKHTCIIIPNHDLFTISKSNATINMNMNTLQISVLNASSYKYGINTLTIRIADSTPIYDTFEIAKIPEITSLGPTAVAAGASTNFTVRAYSPKNNTIVRYDWDFGDEETDSTLAPNSVHTYNSIKTFNLTVTVTDKEGLVNSKTFTITSTSPGGAINSTIAAKKSILAIFTSQYSSIPSWYKPLFAKFDTTELGSILSRYEQDAKVAAAPDLISIKQKLDSLAIPQSIIDAVKVTDSVPIFSTEKISLSYIQKAGAGDYDENNAEQIKELISNWQSQLGIKLSGTVKKVKTDIGEEDVATIITIKSNPTTEIDSLYLIVNLPSSVQFADVKFDSTTGKNLNGAIGFEISGSAKTINLAIAGNQNINLLEVYGSPTFETLMAAIPVETKCGNTKCDAGENSQNCPSDCPPLAKGITFIIMIILGAGIGIFLIWKVYAAIYERSQEMKVFKNRNDLISVTMFIVNAKVRGMPENEIREKLEKASWNNEQIAFAFLKVEKRKKEIEKKIKEAKKLIEHKI